MTTIVSPETVNASIEQGVASTLSLILILTLVVVAIAKELTVVAVSAKSSYWGSILSVASIPLFLAFGVIVVVRVFEIL